MAEKLAEVIADLETLREYEGPSDRGFRQAGLSHTAEIVLEKLKAQPLADGLHRVYRQTPRGIQIADVLSDRDIAIREYEPTGAEPQHLDGPSPAKRDVIHEHTTKRDRYDKTLWIGERLE